MFSGLSRRQLLRLISGLLVGSVAVGSIPFFGKLFASKAQAQEKIKEVKYKDRTYKIITKVTDDTPKTFQDGAKKIENPFDAPVELYLDGAKVNILRDKKTNKYATHLLPFTQYDSPDALALTLIDLGVKVPKGDISKDKSKFDDLI